MSPVARTNIELDDELVRKAMQLYGCKTKREVVDLALRELVGEAMTLEEALAMQGTGWGGDLDAMREKERREAAEDLERPDAR